MTPLAEAWVEVMHLYGRQSLAIDGGDATGWAATFTDDGVFDSPTYPEPITGAAALTDFAAGLHEGSPHLHHVVANLAVDEVTEEHVTARANLLIVTTHDLGTGSARIDRITTIHDRFVRRPDLLLEHRLVVRDGTPDPTSQGVPHD
ncbi:nuclear transport factor 2 family protein [Janibacter corallicola]|uniref:nuclear transport factor 2 family protein n=1 Tax=Janibacter corallicola TaxID=415212 RepID=UPI000A076282|nr:nuclear transport factor 2 family protein [Janibacter corallicola]